MFKSKVLLSFLCAFVSSTSLISCARAGIRTNKIELTIDVYYRDNQAYLTLSNPIISNKNFIIIYPDDVVPGDSIIIEYAGEAYFEEQYPSNLRIIGDIVGYSFGYNNEIKQYYFNDNDQYHAFIEENKIDYVINSKDLSFENASKRYFDNLFITTIIDPFKAAKLVDENGINIKRNVAYSFNPRI